MQGSFIAIKCLVNQFAFCYFIYFKIKSFAFELDEKRKPLDILVEKYFPIVE